MINYPNFEFLKQLSEIYDPIIINKTFFDLINLLKAYLNLDLINKKIEIHFLEDDIINPGNEFDYFIEEGAYHVVFYKNYRTFFPFLILQSAYLAFIPNNLKETKFIDFALSQFVEFDLKEFPLIDEWRSIVRKKYINYNFVSDQAEKFRFAKFFELEELNSTQSPKKFFFQYIRQHSHISFDDDLQYLNEKIYEQFLFKTSRTLYNSDIAETLRILTYIFYRVKDCDTLLTYYKCFKTFKNLGYIQTNLSFRKFKSNLQWINRFTRITPTYYFDWKSLDIAYLACYFKFNPHLEKPKIDLIVKQMPFLIMPKLSINDFATELSAYFVVPRIYLNDIKYFFEKMEQWGYIIEKRCSIATKYNFSINLNYLREFHSKGQIIDFNNKKYSKDYELEFEQEYSKKSLKQPITLLDFLIWHFSTM